MLRRSQSTYLLELFVDKPAIPEHWVPRIVGVIELVLVVALVTMWSGILLLYVRIDCETILDEYEKEYAHSPSLIDTALLLLAEDVGALPSLLLLGGQIVYILVGLLGLWFCRHSELWKWTGAFAGSVLAVSAVTTLRFSVQSFIEEDEAEESRIVLGLVLYFVQNSASVIFLCFCVCKLEQVGWACKFLFLVGALLFQLIFPLVFTQDRSKSFGFAVLALSLSLISAAYCVNRVVQSQTQRISSGETEPILKDVEKNA